MINNMMNGKKLLLFVLCIFSLLCGCGHQTSVISRNTLGYDLTTVILSGKTSALKDIKTISDDSDTFWFTEEVFDKDVCTVLSLSENHKELWFYSKTWTFEDVTTKSFSSTQNAIVAALNELYGKPVQENSENNLLYLDRSVSPHTKTYAPWGVWKANDGIIVILNGGKAGGNAEIYAPSSTHGSSEYYLQIDYRIDYGYYDD